MLLHPGRAVISVQNLDASVHEYRDLGFAVIMGGVQL
jgi:hypothetical protein